MKNNLSILTALASSILLLSTGCQIPDPSPSPENFSSPSSAKNDPILGDLLEGNKRFVAGTSTHALQDMMRRRELTNGQRPHTIVVSCSDSRVPPELIFDAGLGELFVVRSAGEVVDAVALASIEYAVEHLGANLLVVMGHESCGAVKAALETPAGKSAGSPSLDKLVASIRPNIAKIRSSPEDKLLLAPVRANVEGITSQLMHDSEIIHEALVHKKLKIVSAVYHLGTGAVEFWDTH